MKIIPQLPTPGFPKFTTLPILMDRQGHIAIWNTLSELTGSVGSSSAIASLKRYTMASTWATFLRSSFLH